MALKDPNGFLLRVHPDLRRLAQFLADDATPGIDILVTAGDRPMSDQKALYDQGRTTPGNIVTNAQPGESAHNFALAIDVVPVKDGKALWSDTAAWDRLGSAARRFATKFPDAERIVWGGTWSNFRDAPHFELAAWRAIKDGWRPVGFAEPIFLVAIAAALLLVIAGGFL